MFFLQYSGEFYKQAELVGSPLLFWMRKPKDQEKYFLTPTLPGEIRLSPFWSCLLRLTSKC